MRIIDSSISRDELTELAKESFGDMVKAVVDIERGIMAVGGELHADEEAMLIEQGSRLQDLWGVNFYPEKIGESFVEFNSMINIRPSQGNRTRDIEDVVVREKILKVVNTLARK